MELNMTHLILTAAAGYLLGNISPAYLIGKKFAHIDIRKHGSGNAGTTNSLRLLGKKKAAAVLLIDALKGVVAAQLGFRLGGERLALVGALAVIIGHVFPIFLNFKGGKGVATTLGSLLSIFPAYGSIALLIGIALIFRTRIVSLGSMVGVVSMALIVFFSGADRFSLMIVSFIALFVLFTHRENISRLIKGTERKLGEK